MSKLEANLDAKEILATDGEATSFILSVYVPKEWYVFISDKDRRSLDLCTGEKLSDNVFKLSEMIRIQENMNEGPLVE